MQVIMLVSGDSSKSHGRGSRDFAPPVEDSSRLSSIATLFAQHQPPLAQCRSLAGTICAGERRSEI